MGKCHKIKYMHTRKGRGRGRREAQEGGDICIFTADSSYYTAETNTTCKAIVLQLKIKKK